MSRRHKTKHPIVRYLEAHRDEKGKPLSKAELARRAGLSRSLIARTTSNDPKVWQALGREALLSVIKATQGELGFLELAEWRP